VVIIIAIHPVELQPWRDFGSEADLYLLETAIYFMFSTALQQPKRLEHARGT
jgi:hypothetical protein